MRSIDDDLARERLAPPEAGADRQALAAVRLAGFGSLIMGSLDLGWWQLAPVPEWLRSLGFAGTVVFATLIFRAMRANHYFSRSCVSSRTAGTESWTRDRMPGPASGLCG